MLAGADLLRDDFGVEADVWSVPSFTELRRDGMEAERWNTLHPGEDAETTWIEELLGDRPARDRGDGLHALATRTRSARGSTRPTACSARTASAARDYRKTLRSFFEVDRHHVALAALTELAKTGEVDAGAPKKAIETYGIDPERPAPWKV